MTLKADEGFIFESGKIYTHSVGLSCAFRQWRAHSHCKFLHGYSLQVAFTFRARDLNVTNWVVDFGALKGLKGWLEDLLDHKTLVAADDPHLSDLEALDKKGVIQMRIVPHCGMEALSYYIFQFAEQWLIDNGFTHAELQEVEVKEHDSNFARYRKIGIDHDNH